MTESVMSASSSLTQQLLRELEPHTTELAALVAHDLATQRTLEAASSDERDQLRDAHQDRMVERMQRLGLDEVGLSADDDTCIYRAFALALYQDQERFDDVRQAMHAWRLERLITARASCELESLPVLSELYSLPVLVLSSCELEHWASIVTPPGVSMHTLLLRPWLMFGDVMGEQFWLLAHASQPTDISTEVAAPETADLATYRTRVSIVDFESDDDDDDGGDDDDDDEQLDDDDEDDRQLGDHDPDRDGDGRYLNGHLGHSESQADSALGRDASDDAGKLERRRTATDRSAAAQLGDSLTTPDSSETLGRMTSMAMARDSSRSRRSSQTEDTVATARRHSIGAMSRVSSLPPRRASRDVRIAKTASRREYEAVYGKETPRPGDDDDDKHYRDLDDGREPYADGDLGRSAEDGENAAGLQELIAEVEGDLGEEFDLDFLETIHSSMPPHMHRDIAESLRWQFDPGCYMGALTSTAKTLGKVRAFVRAFVARCQRAQSLTAQDIGF